MLTNVKPLPGRERYRETAGRLVAYQWQSECGSEQFDTIAYNLEAARAKLRKQYQPKGLFPVLQAH